MTAPGEARPGAVVVDDRSLIRILIASSNELKPEREALDRLVEEELAVRPDLARNFRFQCLRWEEDATPTHGERINLQIDKSLDLDDVDIVIGLVWRKIGTGTREEIELSRRRSGTVGRPTVLIYRRREPYPASREARALLDEVDAFCRELVDQDQIVSEVDDVADLTARLRDQLPRVLPTQHQPGHRTEPALANRRFLIFGGLSLALSAATLVLTQTMSFPTTNVGSWPVLLTLMAAPILGLLALATRWTFGRLLDSFVNIWFSPAYRNEEIYRAFDWVIPTRVLPERVRRPLARTPGADAWRWGLLSLLLGAPIVGQYTAIFDEILLWDLVVGRDVIVSTTAASPTRSPDGRPCGAEPARNTEPIESCFVDHRPDGRWPLGLQDPLVREKHSQLVAPVIFVYAHAQFADVNELPQGQKELANRGPEVFPPRQPALYLGLFALSALGQLHGMWRLGRLAKELRPRIESPGGRTGRTSG